MNTNRLSISEIVKAEQDYLSDKAYADRTSKHEILNLIERLADLFKTQSLIVDDKYNRQKAILDSLCNRHMSKILEKIETVQDLSNPLEFLKLTDLRNHWMACVRASGWEYAVPVYYKRTGSVAAQLDSALRTCLFTPLEMISEELLKSLISSLPKNFRPFAIMSLLCDRYVHRIENTDKLKNLISILHSTEVIKIKGFPDIYNRLFFLAPYRIDVDPTYIVRRYIMNSIGAGQSRPLSIDVLEKLIKDGDRSWLVLHEWEGSHHAMARCWEPFVAGIRNKNKIVEKSVDFFKQKGPIAKSFKNFIKDQKIDVIFFPSIGMRAMGSQLGAVRTDAIQIAGLGHPGEYPNMPFDGIVGYGDLQWNVATRTPYLDLGSLKFQKHPDFLDRSLYPKKSDSQGKRIAINAKALKLSPPFLRFLASVKMELPECSLVFFPTEAVGVNFKAIERRLKILFPTDEVVHYVDYSVYLSKLRECDAAISPFPFGNTNSIIDCLIVNIPNFSLYGSVPQSSGDRGILEQVGLDSSLAKTERELLDKIHEFFSAGSFRDSVIDAVDKSFELIDFID